MSSCVQECDHRGRARVFEMLGGNEGSPHCVGVDLGKDCSLLGDGEVSVVALTPGGMGLSDSVVKGRRRDIKLMCHAGIALLGC